MSHYLTPTEGIPVMTIRVYSVRADGTTDTIRDRREIEPATDAPASLAYPPCSCPRCAPAPAREAAR